MERLTVRLADELTVARKESADLRQQQGQLNREFLRRRDCLKKDLEEARAEVDRMETENAKLVEKSSRLIKSFVMLRFYKL